MKRLVLAVVLAAVVAVIPSPASANTAPNPYTVSGTSWVDVPSADRVYLENFGSTIIEDEPLYFVGAGVSCINGGVTATGPFLTANANLDQTKCTSGGSPFDPIDTATRLGALPFGFALNFFGTQYEGAWPSTNGAIGLRQPVKKWNRSAANFVWSSESDAILPLQGDLTYSSSESNFWMAQTTIEGNKAVVFSWEKFHTYNWRGPSSDNLSFQLVLIQQAGGDAIAYYNYDKVAGPETSGYVGYAKPQILFDLATDVTVGSNIIRTEDVLDVPTSCSRFLQTDVLGTPTDRTYQLAMNSSYLKRVSEANKTISAWADSSCTIPKSPTSLQNVAADGHAYLELHPPTTVYALNIGLGHYDPVTKLIRAFELFRNVPLANLANGGSDELVAKSLNTTVPGRLVIGISGGAATTDRVSLVPDALEGGSPAAKRNPIPTVAWTCVVGLATPGPVAGLKWGRVEGTPSAWMATPDEGIFVDNSPTFWAEAPAGVCSPLLVLPNTGQEGLAGDATGLGFLAVLVGLAAAWRGKRRS